MTVKLALLKSGEEIIADIKEIRTEKEDVVGYYFTDPLVLTIVENDEPVVYDEDPLKENESGVTKTFLSKIAVNFYPWIPLSKDRQIPCSADWVVTIVEPQTNIKKLYQEKVDGNKQNDQVSVVSDEGDTDN